MRTRINLTSFVCFAGALAFLALPPFVARANAQQENAAVKPLPRDGIWMKRHEKFVEMAKKGGIDVLFVGDALTDEWGGEGHEADAPGAKLFAKDFEPLKAANFGIGGDKTQNVLWRLQNGELDGIQPKVLMLLVGTNNSNGNDHKPEEIAEGITAIVKEIQKKSPQTKILLLGIFPRAPKPDDPYRKKIKDVNAIVAKLDDGKTVKYLDIGDKFLQPDGTITLEIMRNYLHFTPKGYEIWDAAVKEPINELLKK